MDCARCREILSAHLDGEDQGGEVVDAGGHQASCVPCQVFWIEVSDLHRNLRIRPAESVPDLAEQILESAPAFGARRLADLSGARIALGGVGLVLLLLALPTMVLHDGGGMAVHHLTRELAAFQVALAVGFLWVAWRPERAEGLFPTAAALVGALVAIAVVDLSRGHAPSLAEAQHLVELTGVALVWLVGRGEVPVYRDRHRLHPI
jgi:predicted anti-sigma-YlaC factor YlaD